MDDKFLKFNDFVINTNICASSKNDQEGPWVIDLAKMSKKIAVRLLIINYIKHKKEEGLMGGCV